MKICLTPNNCFPRLINLYKSIHINAIPLIRVHEEKIVVTIYNTIRVHVSYFKQVLYCKGTFDSIYYICRRFHFLDNL